MVNQNRPSGKLAVLWPIYQKSRILSEGWNARFSFHMRNLRPEKPRSLAGSLLVAHPNMLDPNFRRAVLFISAHDPEDGAIGVILNRPLDKHVSDLVSDEPPAGL